MIIPPTLWLFREECGRSTLFESSTWLGARGSADVVNNDVHFGVLDVDVEPFFVCLTRLLLVFQLENWIYKLKIQTPRLTINSTPTW